MKRTMLRIIGAILALPLAKFARRGKVIFPVVFLGLVFARRAAAAEVTMDVVNWFVSLIASFATLLAEIVGKLIVLLIGGVAVPLMQYNEFATSPAVGMGWSVVRDAVNMFFVIILIIIAFGTILGIERFKWRQQIPGILIMAVVINFSRALCGILIDFSQIIMLTFVNAIKDIAGGNFIQMFQLNGIMDADSASSVFSGGPGPFDMLGAALVALLMMLIVLVSMTFLTIALAYRIVLLWALVTVAPLAWFFKPVQSILGMKKNPYTDWWSKFTCALQLGPILVFFLWLALAVAGSGSVLPAPTTASGEGLDAGIMLKIMGEGRMVNFIVGILLLFVGLDAANDACAGSDGIMSGLMGKARGLSKGVAVGVPAWLGQKGMQGISSVGKSIYRNTSGRLVKGVRNQVGTKLDKFAKENPQSIFAGFAGRNAARIKAKQGAEIAEVEKERGAVSTQERISNVLTGPGLGEKNKLKHLADIQAILGDEEAMKEIGPEKMAEILNKKMPLSGGKNALRVLDDIGDPAWKKQRKELGKSRPSIFGDKAIEKGLVDASSFRNLDDSEFSQRAVLNQAKKVNFTKTVNGVEEDYLDAEGNNVSVYEAMKQGLMDKKMKKKLEDGENTLKKKEKPENLLRGDVSRINTANLPVSSLAAPVLSSVLMNGTDAQVAALGERTDLGDHLNQNSAAILADVKQRAHKTFVSPDGSSYTERDQPATVAARTRLLTAGADLASAFEFDTASNNFGAGAVGAENESDFREAAGTQVEVATQALVSGVAKVRQIAMDSLRASMVRNLLRQHRNAAAGSAEKTKTEKQLETIFKSARQTVDGYKAIGKDIPTELDSIVNHLYGSYKPSPPPPPAGTP